MSIDIRRLHPTEYDLLRQIDDGFVPDPDDSKVIVGESGGKVVSRLFAMRPWHVEGIYIEPAWRGGPLFKNMMNAMEIECRAEGLSRLFAYSVRPEIGHYIQHRCGYHLTPWSVYMKDIA